jgi:RNA polymerase sigma factor (TIGR02999 family)
MTSLTMSEVSHLLNALEDGDPHAAEQLLPLVYDELRKLAALRLAQEKPGQTLQATALVHEAYLRLVAGQPNPRWNSRAHFFAAAAQAMRRILVENARRKRRLKHGGGLTREDLDESNLVAAEAPDDLLAVDEALAQLAMVDPRAAELVNLRYFAGLTIPEAAEILGIAPRTADFLWAYARAWLLRKIAGGSPETTGDGSPDKS